MTHRAPAVVFWIGVALLIVSVAWPYSVKLLRNLGVFHGWDGFGFFVSGVRAMPWLAVSGNWNLPASGGGDKADAR